MGKNINRLHWILARIGRGLENRNNSKWSDENFRYIYLPGKTHKRDVTLIFCKRCNRRGYWKAHSEKINAHCPNLECETWRTLRG